MEAPESLSKLPKVTQLVLVVACISTRTIDSLNFHTTFQILPVKKTLCCIKNTVLTQHSFAANTHGTASTLHSIWERHCEYLSDLNLGE